MIGNTAWFGFGKRCPWSWLLLGVVGGVMLLGVNSGQSLSRSASVVNRFEASFSPFSSSFSPSNSFTLADTIRDVSLSPASVKREAAAGHALYYTFSIANLGNLEDRYAISTAGNRWPLTLLSADSTAKISQSGIVPAGKQFQFVVKIDVAGNAAIGASDTASISVHSLTEPAVSDVASFMTISLGPAGSLPWTESFPTLALDRGRWPFNAGPAQVKEVALNEPSAPFSLNFDGDASGGDEVRSQPINLAGRHDVVLQFAFERGSAGNAPENGEDFYLDYFNKDAEWINLRVLLGSGPVMNNFSMESVILPADAYHSSFRFRFRNIATTGPFDDWYVDDIKIFEVKRGRLPFVETFPTLLLDADKWPVSTGTLVDTVGRSEPSPPYAANLQGSSLLQTQPLDLSRESSVSVQYYFQQGGFGDEPEAGDDLLVEFFNAQGGWRLLAQHLGVEGGARNFTHIEAILPAEAFHRDFRLRFRAIGDVGFDDWFVDDVAIQVFLPPEIEVTPATLAAKLLAGDSTRRQLTLQNTGAGELFYRLRVAPPLGSLARLADALYPKDFYQPVLKKQAQDWRAGKRVVLRSGGPDSFGYTWRDSREAGGPPFNWRDISATGRRIFATGDDQNVGPFEIGFAFPFYDSVFTKFRFCTNGFISFTDNASPFTNDPLPSEGGADLVAPFWDDLELSAQSGAHYLADGKQLIVQWTNATGAGSGGPYTFQLILTPAGNIVFQYLQMGEPQNFGTVGIQNHGGLEGLEVAFNTDFVRDNLAVRLERPASWLSFSPNVGQLLSAGSTTVQVRFNASDLIPEATYQTELHVESNDLDEPIITVPVTLEVLKKDPIHFDFDTSKVHYVINIDNATLNNQPLAVGDEIGVFTPEGLTAGAVIWPGSGPARLIAYGDDSTTQKIEGWRRGQNMYFRLWDQVGNREYPATPTYSQGDGRFGTGDSARISLLAAQSRLTYHAALDSGWSWISFNIRPDNPDVAEVMDSVKNLVILSNNAGQFYIPGTINNIGQINVLEGYKTYLNGRDAVQFSGEEAFPGTPIPLLQGWNFVSFLPTVAIAAEAALATIADRMALAKNDAGDFCIPGVINTLGEMRPGRGYRIYMDAPDTLVYPYGALVAKSTRALPALALKHFSPITPTGESYSVVILAAALNGRPLQLGDEIGVFTPAGQLVGAGVWNGKGPLGIAVWRKEEKIFGRESAGFSPGEKMIFRLWRQGGSAARAEGEEIIASAKFRRGNGAFDSDAFALVELATTPLPQQYYLHQSFPNPLSIGNRLANSATGQTLIRYELPQPGVVELRVYNLLGQAVRTLARTPQAAGFHQVTWDGRDDQGRLVAGGIYLYRLQVHSEQNEKAFVAVRKVVVVP